MTFNEWYENADIPVKRDGKWIDLETGIPFTSSKPRAERSKPSDIAKSFGGKALKGTAKQKAWGEDIRANKLAEMSEAAALFICSKVEPAKSATFWIDCRDIDGAGFEKFVENWLEALGIIAKFAGNGKGVESSVWRTMSDVDKKDYQWAVDFTK